jgi:hypothetical protein
MYHLAESSVKDFLEFGAKEKREPPLYRLARDSDSKFAATTNFRGSVSREISEP